MVIISKYVHLDYILNIHVTQVAGIILESTVVIYLSSSVDLRVKPAEYTQTLVAAQAVTKLKFSSKLFILYKITFTHQVPLVFAWITD